MIQRLQSLFLLLASVSFFLLFVFPFAKSDVSGTGFLSDKLYNIMDHPVLLVLTVLGGVVALAAIFVFKNRSLQMRLGLLSIVLSILLPFVAFLLVYVEPDKQGDFATYQDAMGLYLPFMALFFSVLANRFIKKDDNLVRNMDRLR